MGLGSARNRTIGLEEYSVWHDEVEVRMQQSRHEFDFFSRTSQAAPQLEHLTF